MSVCEWCKCSGEVEEVYDAAGARFLLCEECRDVVETFLLDEDLAGERKDARAYNLAQSITGGS